jgi:cell division protein FtsQ
VKVPGAIDPRRRRARRGADSDPDPGYEYEYVYLDGDDADGVDLGEDWEWVEVEVEPDLPADDAPSPARPPRRRGRAVARAIGGLLPLAEHPRHDLDLDVDLAAGATGPDLDGGAGAGTTRDRRPPPARRRPRPLVPAATPSAPTRAGSADDVVVLAGTDDHADRWDDEGWVEDGWDLADPAQGVAVDPRIAARRDSVASARTARLRTRLVSVAVVLAVLVGVGALTRSAVLDVDTITVSGASRADTGSVVAASGISPGTPLIGLDLDAAEAGVRAEPWVLDATVERTWSGAVSIAVVEREPVATVNAGDGGWLLVDGGRRVVASSIEPPPLPIVDGVGVASVGDELAPEAQAALDVARALTPALRTRVLVVNGADPDAVELTLQPSGTVRFGPATDLEARVRTLQATFAEVDLICLDTISLPVPDRAVLTRVPACA